MCEHIEEVMTQNLLLKSVSHRAFPIRLVQVPRRGALSCDGLPPAGSASASGGDSCKAGRPLLSQHPAKDKRREISRFFGDVPPPASAAAAAAAAQDVQQTTDAAPDLVQPADQAPVPAVGAAVAAAAPPQPGNPAAAAAPTDTPEGQWRCQCANWLFIHFGSFTPRRFLTVG